MAIGSPGAEQFTDMVVAISNRHIPAGMLPLINLRQELTSDRAIVNRAGMTSTTKEHYIKKLVECDRWRRRVTWNPDQTDLRTLIDESKDVDNVLTEGDNPFSGDTIQHGASSLFMLPWDFSGGDDNIPLLSEIQKRMAYSATGILLLSAVDDSLVRWTRLESRHRSKFITTHDSFRVLETYQQILGFFNAFAGDENYSDFAQMLPTEEPAGLPSASNRVEEEPRVPNPGGVQ